MSIQRKRIVFAFMFALTNAAQRCMRLRPIAATQRDCAHPRRAASHRLPPRRNCVAVPR
ncbi:hypothetical protein GLE_2357 [Lysobacter enzymogenes]|uniref:Uncharacterized protein n=1 Tax=Lysobacter enzymogenes TaxID=69 RepID=A0A0S2DGP4_LYSEN|nr:hypothetical protein GLE_2357 [Lysobacter enzymogenes]